MSRYIHLIPTYGRDYSSKKAVLEDLRSGKDFMIADISNPYNGKVCNIADLRSDYDCIQVRYKQCRQVAIIKMSEII